MVCLITIKKAEKERLSGVIQTAVSAECDYCLIFVVGTGDLIDMLHGLTDCRLRHFQIGAGLGDGVPPYKAFHVDQLMLGDTMDRSRMGCIPFPVHRIQPAELAANLITSRILNCLFLGVMTRIELLVFLGFCLEGLKRALGRGFWLQKEERERCCAELMHHHASGIEVQPIHCIFVINRVWCELHAGGDDRRFCFAGLSAED